MRATLFGIGLVARERLSRGSWVQDSKLRAANALRTDGLSLTRAAEAVGYQSYVVFAKAFKRVTGESPGRYRRGQTPSLTPQVPPA